MDQACRHTCASFHLTRVHTGVYAVARPFQHEVCLNTKQCRQAADHPKQFESSLDKAITLELLNKSELEKTVHHLHGLNVFDLVLNCLKTQIHHFIYCYLTVNLPGLLEFTHGMKLDTEDAECK